MCVWCGAVNACSWKRYCGYMNSKNRLQIFLSNLSWILKRHVHIFFHHPIFFSGFSYFLLCFSSPSGVLVLYTCVFFVWQTLTFHWIIIDDSNSVNSMWFINNGLTNSYCWALVTDNSTGNWYSQLEISSFLKI